MHHWGYHDIKHGTCTTQTLTRITIRHHTDVPVLPRPVRFTLFSIVYHWFFYNWFIGRWRVTLKLFQFKYWTLREAGSCPKILEIRFWDNNHNWAKKSNFFVVLWGTRPFGPHFAAQMGSKIKIEKYVSYPGIFMHNR